MLGKVIFVNHFDEHKWPAKVFFLTCGLFFFGCVWYLWAGALNPDYYWQSPTGVTADSPPDLALEKNGRVMIAKRHRCPA